MRDGIQAKLLTAIMVGSLVLTGCGSKPAPTAPAVSDKANKPALDVPKTFPSESAKQQFATKAVVDGYYAEATSLLEESVAAEPIASSYALLGTARYNLHEYTKAAEAWQKAAELNPKWAGEMLNNVGNALRDGKKAAEAEAAYRKSLQVEPTRWTAALNLATMLHEHGKTPEAIAALEGALPANNKVQPLISLLDAYKKAAPKP